MHDTTIKKVFITLLLIMIN